jgi:hypothetical protein
MIFLNVKYKRQNIKCKGGVKGLPVRSSTIQPLLHFTFENSPRVIFIPGLFSKQYRNKVFTL